MYYFCILGPQELYIYSEKKFFFAQATSPSPPLPPPTDFQMISQERVDAGADPGFFPRRGSGVKICHRQAYSVLGEGTEGCFVGLPQENFEYEVL